MLTSAAVPARAMALDALGGRATPRAPVALFTWEFDYLWKVAGLEPWQLACGDHETWHRAHMARRLAGSRRRCGDCLMVSMWSTTVARRPQRQQSR